LALRGLSISINRECREANQYWSNPADESSEMKTKLLKVCFVLESVIRGRRKHGARCIVTHE